MQLKTYCLIVWCVGNFLCAQTVVPSSDTDSSFTQTRYPVYVDLATLLLLGNSSINVEIPYNDHFLFRIGYGNGWITTGFNSASSSGMLTMLNFVSGGGDFRFEFGMGGSVVKRSDRGDTKILPAIILGSRYQPGRFIFRYGIGYTFSFGTPIYISIGAVL